MRGRGKGCGMNNKGFGVVEYIIVLMVLILLALLFREHIVSFVSKLLQIAISD